MTERNHTGGKLVKLIPVPRARPVLLGTDAPNPAAAPAGVSPKRTHGAAS